MYTNLFLSFFLSLSLSFYIILYRWSSSFVIFLTHDLYYCKELPVIGTPNWYYLTLLSPYAGIYYWRSGDRTDEFSIKLEANDEETENSINVQGSEDEIERMWRALEWQEKGMVKVPGLLGE
ncbi:MAG: hypothetical protein ACI8RD_006036 [Bacillariaceae sp.]|jgi:hypothetical protein